MAQVLPWVLFIAFIIGALWVDFALLGKKDEEVSITLALKMAGFWITLGLLFCVGVYWVEGEEPALKYLTGYLIEKSLSLDNLFAFIIIFSYFQVPAKYQPKALFLGIIGAIVMRLIFILAGVTLLQTFYWMVYVFGIFLIYAGVKLFTKGKVNVQPEKNAILNLFKKIMPVESSFHGSRFFVKIGGLYYATPLFVTVIVIETTDMVFAVETIPAIMAITLDPFIIYTSNIFAILGMRATYFALAGFMKMFRYLSYGLSLILIFLGAKMAISHYYKISVYYSLGFILLTLLLCVALSLLFNKEKSQNAKW